jgi:hypothetical protein
VPARAETAHMAVLIDRRDFGVFVHQPFRRRRRRRTEHDLQAGGTQRIHGSVEPAEIERVPLRLQPRPGEFADAHEGNAHVPHAPGVLCPPCFWPVFRIIANAQHYFVKSPLMIATPEASKRWQALAGIPMRKSAPGCAVARPSALTAMSVPSPRLT